MKQLLSVLFIFSTFITQAQRKKADIDVGNVKATKVTATEGNFTRVTGIDSTLIDNANGPGDSLWVKKGSNTIQFKKFRLGSNVRAAYEGDSVITFSGLENVNSQVYYPRPGENGTITTGYTGIAGGSLAARTPLSTSLLTSATRVGYVSAATAGSVSYYYPSGSPNMWRGNVAGRGGFYTMLRFGLPTTVSGFQAFFGLCVTPITTAVNPSGQFNIVGVGKDNTDGTLQFMTNDGTGTAVKTSTGLTAPTSGTTVYNLEIFAAANSSNITMVLTDLSNPSSPITHTTGSTDIPANTQFLKFALYLSNNTTASAVSLDIVKIYAEAKL